MTQEKFTFFWNGPFSQWHPSKFEIDGITYNCAEQYMMAQKAILFNDSESLEKIMQSDSPREQKALGRKVKNFDAKKWNEIAKSVVSKGNLAKFQQNEELREELFKTQGTTLVEASPFDKVWGIGLDEKNPLAQNRETWKGTNWLGEVLTDVREKLMVNYEVCWECL